MPFRFRLAAGLLLAWIGMTPALVRADDVSNPHLKEAQQDLDNNKPGEAAGEFEAALAVDPKLPMAEYELGLLYSESLHDPISSIYHLRHFLALSPNSDKAQSAKDLMDKESKLFAATVPSEASDMVTKLQEDLAQKNKQLDDASKTITLLQGQLAKQAAAPQAVATDAPAPAVGGPQKALPLDQMNPSVANPDAPAPAATGTAGPQVNLAGARSYTVVSGDSIWKIAHKMYPGHTKEGMEKINEANKDAIGGKPLKIGQVLVIPQ
jgi:Tfp pilus assembly protein FimV